MTAPPLSPTAPRGAQKKNLCVSEAFNFIIFLCTFYSCVLSAFHWSNLYKLTLVSKSCNDQVIHQNLHFEDGIEEEKRFTNIFLSAHVCVTLFMCWTLVAGVDLEWVRGSRHPLVKKKKNNIYIIKIRKWKFKTYIM